MIAPPPAPSTAPEKTTDELIQHVSASRLNTFHQCRLKFYFRYVLGLQKTKSPALHVGTTVHAVLQAWNRARWKKQSITDEALQGVFEKSWREEQADAPVSWEGEDEAKEKDAAWNLLRSYFAQNVIPHDEKPEAVEVPVECDLSQHGLTRLVGIIDLVRAGGRIVDFKTSATTPNSERVVHLHETQLACYALLYRDATGTSENGIELHHLIKQKTPKIAVTPLGPMTDGQKTKLFRAIDSYLNGIRSRDWIPSPNVFNCACCEYWRECRAWT
jgi:CRISPR/Cas system-associated exonuclease Cas4 (RecB family)